MKKGGCKRRENKKWLVQKLPRASASHRSEQEEGGWEGGVVRKK